MSVLDRGALESSPLADLHAIASELSIDGYRRLRRDDLIDAILARQEGGPPESGTEAEGGPAGAEDGAAEPEGGETEAEGGAEAEGEAADRAPARRRGRRGGRSRTGGRGGSEEDEGQREETHPEGPREIERELEPAEPELVEGVVELLPGGSGFVRVHPPDPSNDDVYVSSAQVKRCELVTGDRITGPRRSPRRSERFASLVRVDTVNGRPAEELADGVRFDDLPVAFPSQRLEPSREPDGIESILAAAPIGRGSRMVIAGPPGSGKTEILRGLAKELGADESLQVWVVLTGARPEEVPEWERAGVSPAVKLSFAASADAQSQALEGVVEQVRRLVARGSHAVVLIDGLDAVLPSVARKALASARNVIDGGSLTVIATAAAPLGGETSVLSLRRPQPDGGERFPVIDPAESWTIRRELLG